MQRDFLEVGILVLGVTFLLLDSAVWSGWTHFKEYPPCRLATLLQPLDLHGKSLTECAAVCSLLSDCATVSYHGHSHSCELAARDAFLDGCSDTADTADWRTFGRKEATIYSLCADDAHCFEGNMRCLQWAASRTEKYCHCLSRFEYSAHSGSCEQACSAYGTTWPTSFLKIAETSMFGWRIPEWQCGSSPENCAAFCVLNDCESFEVRYNTGDNDPCCYLKTISIPEANRSRYLRSKTNFETYMRLCA